LKPRLVFPPVTDGREDEAKRSILMGSIEKETKTNLIPFRFHQEFLSERNQKFATFLKREKSKWT
jgi:hypothetical protein